MADKNIKLTVEQEKALYFYDLYSETYRNLLSEYKRLMAEKKKLNIRLKTLNKDVLEDYPECELLSIENRDEAIAWIKNHERRFLNDEINRIDIIVKENYSYRSLVSWIEDSKAQIKAKAYRDKRAGFYCTSQTKTPTICKRTCGS